MDVVAEVDDEQIAEALANWTGIPVFKLTEEETTRLLRMEDELHKRIIGQEEAIKSVSQAIRRTRAGLKDPRRPGGSFIFAGPSGVGKTELAKALAQFLFGEDDALIQIDMGEFHDRFTVSRLVGAPPGYVGYDEGGQDRKSTRLNSSHANISYAVFCLKKKNLYMSDMCFFFNDTATTEIYTLSLHDALPIFGCR